MFENTDTKDDSDKDSIMKKMIKIWNMMLCMLVLMPLLQVHAKKSEDFWPKQSEKITASAAILMDMDTGTILYKKNINKKYHPASITKILTTLVAIENSRMDEVVTFSSNAIYNTGGSGISRDVGEKMTMKECLYAVMLESANECAYAVAEHVGGTYQNFIKMMNDKAKALGCTSSNFRNPHGLTEEKHYVTARDMALIAKAAYENETFRMICGAKIYIIPPTNKHSEQTILANHHKMFYPKDTSMYLYEYCLGGKTGWTTAAGNTLVTYAQKGGMSLVSVILNGISPDYWIETRTLFDYGFENFNIYNVAEYAKAGENYSEEKYDILNVNEPYAKIDPQAKVVLPKTVDFSKATMKISYKNLKKTALAKLKYIYGGRQIGEANIVRTNVSIDQSEFLNSEEETDASKSDSQTGIEPAKSDDQAEDSKKILFGIFDFGKFDLKKIDFNFNLESLKSLFFDTVSNVQDFFKTIPSQKLILIAGVAAGIVLTILIFGKLLRNSYVIRQRIADRRRRRRESRQYTVIRDTRKNRRRRRRR